MKKSNKIILTLISGFIFLNAAVLPFNHVYADENDPMYQACYNLYHKQQSVQNLTQLVNSLISYDLVGVADAIKNQVISTKTLKSMEGPCALYLNDPGNKNHHGGKGGTFEIVQKNAEDDLKNGGNRNYYVDNNYNQTSNYSINNTSYNSLSYTYNNTNYNYAYDYDYTTYNITNNEYVYKLTNNNYLTVVNNYNNTQIIDNGNTYTLYYALPDGSNSLNLTEEEALNGYKTSLSVSSYNNFYDDDNLVALYHFDGNQYDAAYPTNAQLTFDKSSIEYVNAQNNAFGQALALSSDSTFNVNKSGKFSSFRFYPLINKNWSLNINNQDLGSSELIYDSINEYDEFYNENLIKNTSRYIKDIYKYSDNLYIFKVNAGNEYYFIGTSIQQIIDSINTFYSAFKFPYNADQFINSFVDPAAAGSTVSIGTMWIKFTDSSLSVDYLINNGIAVNSTFNTINVSYNYKGDISYFYSYDVDTFSSNRSYNWINTTSLDNTGICNLINFNMWNYLAIQTDGSVYINGVYSNIDIDNSTNLSVNFGGDSITYVDELALFNNDRSVQSPQFPYDNNIVYSVPEYYENISVYGVKINNLCNLNYNDNLSVWAYPANTINYVSDHVYYLHYKTQLLTPGDLNEWLSRVMYQYNGRYYTLGYLSNSYDLNDIKYYFDFPIEIIYLYGSGNNSLGPGGSTSYNQAVLIDLTLMFGEGYEPSKEWCDQNLTDYIAYNVNPDVTESSYNIETGYTYIKQVVSDLSKNNELLIQSIIPVNNWQFGGYRPSSPVLGDVYVSVDDLGYITSVQQFNGIEWQETTAGLFNVNMMKWLNAIGFNIFNNNWEYTDYKYKSKDPETNIFIQYFTDTFNNIFNIDNSVNNYVDNGTNDLNNKLETIHQTEQSLINQFNTASGTVELSPLQQMGTKFMSSASWVKTQFDTLITEENSTQLNPYGLLLTASLSIGLALLIIGKVL